MATIQGVLAYAKIQEPGTKYQSTTEREYSVDVIVSEDQADEWNELFPKQTAKVVKTLDFEKIYKIPAPFPEEKKQYVIKLKRPAQYKDGNPIAEQYRPKVLQKKGNVNVDITHEVLVANGSEGFVSYETNSNDFGTFARLRNVLVTKLIPYERSASADDDFGDVVTSEVAEASDDFVAPAKVAAKKPTRAKAPAPADLDDDLPF